jgi:serine/threonine-protein kinase haspin
MANNEAGYKSWEEHMPYTNVLWIRYLMWWLQTTFRKYGDSKALELFQEDAKELQRGLSPVTKLDDSFATAAQILDYTINKGWITREQALDGHF